jgi:hypothetical protein
VRIGPSPTASHSGRTPARMHSRTIGRKGGLLSPLQ